MLTVDRHNDDDGSICSIEQANKQNEVLDAMRSFANLFADCYFEMRNGGDKDASESSEEKEKG